MLTVMQTNPTIPEERRAFLSKIGRKGGLKRAEAFTSDFQRRARACVSHEANVANGRKGGIAYVRKYGKRKLVEQARQYRLAHPSDLERAVESALIAIGAEDYEREAYTFPKSHCHLNTGDFVFRKQHKIVYADGAAWHNGKELPASFVNCVDRAMRDEKMDTYLRYRGWQVLRLTEQEIRAHMRGTDGGAMLDQLRRFVGHEWCEAV
jgi:very-short-patch-repair endonuclease